MYMFLTWLADCFCCCHTSQVAVVASTTPSVQIVSRWVFFCLQLGLVSAAAQT
jgi:hypothetical protein